MDRAATLPATRPRLPKLSDLTPEEQQALLAEGWTAADDGTLSPPGQAGGQQNAYDYDAGGFSGALGGPPATSPPAGAMPGGMGMGMGGNAATEVPPDALSARIEFADPEGNPMNDALPEPFEVPEVTPPLRAQPAPDLKAAARTYTGNVSTGDESSGNYGGRIGRRKSSQQSKPSGRPMSSRRRR